MSNKACRRLWRDQAGEGATVAYRAQWAMKVGRGATESAAASGGIRQM